MGVVLAAEVNCATNPLVHTFVQSTGWATALQVRVALPL